MCAGAQRQGREEHRRQEEGLRLLLEEGEARPVLAVQVHGLQPRHVQS